MTKVHHFQRYSSRENVATNNVLQLISRVCAYSADHGSRLLESITGEPVEIGVEISQQTRAPDSVPDGGLVHRGFKILVETKVDAPVDAEQLRRHTSGFGNEPTKILLLLTREELSADEAAEVDTRLRVHGDVNFAATTFGRVCRAARELFREWEHEMVELVADFEAYCNDTGLFDQSRDLMRMVPCGTSLSLNKKYGIYFQPSDRSYTAHSYVGIYAEKAIHSLWAIDSVFDVEIVDGALRKSHIQGGDTSDHDESVLSIVDEARRECGYEIAHGHRFFCGVPEDTNYAKRSRGGMLGATYVNLRDVLGDVGDPHEIAGKLSKLDWE